METVNRSRGKASVAPLGYAFSLTARQIIRDCLRGAASEVLIQGQPGTGKTAAGIAAFIIWSLKHENSSFGIIAKTYKQTHTVLAREVRKCLAHFGLPPLRVGLRFADGRGGDGFTLGSNEYVYLSGANIAQEEIIQSHTFRGVYIDEVVNLSQGILQQIENRVRGYDETLIIMTSNYKSRNHYFYKEWVLPAALRHMAIYKMGFDDNPRVDAAHINRMRMRSGGMYTRDYLGEWAALYGRIYSSVNIAKQPSAASVAKWALSVDPAESGVTAALLWGLVDDVWYSFDEWRQEGFMPYLDIARALRRWLWIDAPLSLAVIDPSAPNLRAALSDELGLSVIKANNAVLAGIEWTQHCLASGIVALTDAVPGLLTEIENYAWDERAALEGADKPIKFADHAVDAMRYFCWAIGRANSGGRDVRVVFGQ